MISKRDKFAKKIHIAVTGRQSSGKSSLINTLKGVRNNDPSAARVGIGHTPTGPKPYDYPDKPEIQLWDLPGVDTPEFPMEQYCSLTDFNAYDAFIICTSEKFSEHDLMLTQLAGRQGKQCMLVRTKIDISIQDDLEDHGSQHNERELLQKIHHSMSSQIEGDYQYHPMIYLISTKLSHQNKWQFRDLKTKLTTLKPCSSKSPEPPSHGQTKGATDPGPRSQQYQKTVDDSFRPTDVGRTTRASYKTGISQDRLGNLKQRYAENIGEIAREVVTDWRNSMRHITGALAAYNDSFKVQTISATALHEFVEKLSDHCNKLHDQEEQLKWPWWIKWLLVSPTGKESQIKQNLSQDIISFLTQNLHDCFQEAKRVS